MVQLSGASSSTTTAWGLSFASTSQCGIQGSLWFFLGNDPTGTGLRVPPLALHAPTTVLLSYDLITNSANIYFNSALVAYGSFTASIVQSYLSSQQHNSLCIGCGYTFSGVINNVILTYGATTPTNYNTQSIIKRYYGEYIQRQFAI